MRLNRVAGTIAAVAIVSGCGVTQHDAITVTHPAKQTVSSHPASSHPVSSDLLAARRPDPRPDPSLVWLESAGGQAQVRFNDDVDSMAWALEIESHSPTVANHLVFEADARVVRAEARKILSTRKLLPTVNEAAYKRMLNDFITVANLLQPGPGYGTTAQDYTAWYKALNASNINVS
jgi:hypothetical protein